MKNYTLKLFLLFAGILLTQCLFAQEVNIYFNSASAALRSNDATKLVAIAAEYKSAPYKIELVGHTDTIGGLDYNMKLSLKRSQAVRSFLISKGVKSSDISFNFKGELSPISPDQMYNRRVELIRLKQTAKIETYEELMQSLKPSPQIFTISSTSAASIEGEKGTRVNIPANAFRFKNGKRVTGPVQMQLTEYYSFSDMISSRLSTIADGNLIRTGGMVNIQATSMGEEIYLNDTSLIELAMPKSSEGAFHTFYADTLADGRMNWKLDEELWKGEEEDIAAVVNPDGTLRIVPREEAERLNGLTVYDTATKTFKVLSPTEMKSYMLKRDLEWKQQREEQLKMDSAFDNYYNTIRTRRLGTINCDELIRDPSSRISEMYVDITNPGMQGQNVYLIFKNFNAVIEMQRLEGGTSFFINARLPLSPKARVIVTGLSGGKLYMYDREIQLLIKGREEVKLEESSFEELKKVLKRI